MKKLLAVLLTLALMLGMCSALAEDEPIKLTLWTFQELHTQLYKEMLETWNANPNNPKLDIDMQVYPYDDMHSKLTLALQSGEGAPDIVDIEIVAEVVERGGQGEGFAPRLHTVELTERLDVVDDAEVVFQLRIQNLIVLRLSELVDGRRLGGRLGGRVCRRLGRFDDRRGIGRCFDIFRAGGTKQ